MFVTNSLSFLPQVDEIIMIENGEIVQTGTYEQLKNDEGIFADFISNYLSKAQVEVQLNSKLNINFYFLITNSFNCFI